MKNISKLLIGIFCASNILVTGCIDEITPTNVATGDQLASSAKATEALLWAMPAFVNNFNVLNSLPSDVPAFDWGYGSIMHIRDVMTQEMAVVSHNYDWYSGWAGNRTIDENRQSTQYIWNYYWKFVQTANNMIGTINPETATDAQLGYLGVGYAFRAFQYLDMAMMFEFLPNDGTNSVNSSGNNVERLTVPIVTETISEEEARDNPRATREQMAEFILSDLNNAEQYIANLTRPNKTIPDLTVVYGLKARYYMWLGDYANARTYARRAIANGNYVPTTRQQWLDPMTGFNDISTSSWIWGSQMQQEDDVVKSGILNWTSWMSNEAVYGYSGAGPFLMIDAAIYNQISNDDFRKLSFRAPEGHALDGRMTYIDSEWAEDNIPEYGSLKFRPAAGNTGDANIGSSSAYPLMRIEEMYFIEAEAAAHLNPSEGATLLENFMQTYRYANYVTIGTSQDQIIDEIFLQKRIEFWGEGISLFDYKRLNKPVRRGYSGTNHSNTNRFNTTTRPAWMNFTIVTTEKNNNKALVGYENPDPSDCYIPWVSGN